MVRSTVAALCILFAGSVSVNGQNVEQYSLQGKHLVSIGFGFLGGLNSSQKISDDGATVSNRTEGTTGMLIYKHWFRTDWALNIQGGVSAARSEASADLTGVSAESGAVMSLLFGITFQPEGLALSPVLRPYISVAAGPYWGFSSESSVGLNTTNSAGSQTAPGMRLTAGMDWFSGANKRFNLGLNLGYDFVGDFETPVAAVQNYSGAEFCLSLGFVFH